MPGMSAIHEFLREAHVPYTVVPHRPAFTAQEEAAAAHVPGRDWAKVVICFVDGEPVEAVLPAPSTVNFDQLLALAGGDAIRLAGEEDLRRLFLIARSGRCRRSALYTGRRYSSTRLSQQNRRSCSTPARIAMPLPCVGTTS